MNFIEVLINLVSLLNLYICHLTIIELKTASNLNVKKKLGVYKNIKLELYENNIEPYLRFFINKIYKLVDGYKLINK